MNTNPLVLIGKIRLPAVVPKQAANSLVTERRNICFLLQVCLFCNSRKMLNYKRFTFNYRHSVFIAFLNITYTARHTWATMAYYCEVHPGVISEAMGHSSITVTETYLKPFKNKKIDEANVAVISSLKKVYSVGKLLN